MKANIDKNKFCSIVTRFSLCLISSFEDICIETLLDLVLKNEIDRILAYIGPILTSMYFMNCSIDPHAG